MFDPLSSSTSLLFGRASGYSYDNTLGALLIGSVFAVIIWGVTCVQTYDYFQTYNDRPLQKSIVSFLWILDTLGSVMISQSLYYITVTNYMDPTPLSLPNWGTSFLPVVAGLSALIVRTIFTIRIYSFSKHFILIGSIVVLALTDFAMAIVITTMLARQTLDNIQKVLYSSITISTTCDFAVAISLCWLLHSAKTGFRSQGPDSMISPLMVYVLTTGVLVAITATLAMVTLFALPNTLIVSTFMLPHGKLYVNAYLASLNARTVRRTNSSASVQLSRLDMPQSHSKARQSMGLVFNHTYQTSTFHQNPRVVSFDMSAEQRVEDNSEVKSPPDVVV